MSNKTFNIDVNVLYVNTTVTVNAKQNEANLEDF